MNTTTSVVENAIPSSMKISAIKKELESYGISTRSFIEKSELITALEMARVDRNKNNNTNNKAVDDDIIDSMSISAIRQELDICGISTNTFIERKEFMSALQEARVHGICRSKCRHGFPIAFPPEEKVLDGYNALIETIKRIHGSVPTAKVGTTAMKSLFFNNIPIMSADNFSSKLKEYMIVVGTNILLKGESLYSAQGGLDPKDIDLSVLAKILAQAIIEIEFITDRKYDKGALAPFEKPESKRMKMLRDLTHDGDRSITRFFARRISCTCLKDKYDRVKHQVKMGECFGCEKQMDFKNLLYCTRCSVAHYCNKKCQVEHWPEHKDKCNTVSVKESMSYEMFEALSAGNIYTTDISE